MKFCLTETKLYQALLIFVPFDLRKSVGPIIFCLQYFFLVTQFDSTLYRTLLIRYNNARYNFLFSVYFKDRFS